PQAALVPPEDRRRARDHARRQAGAPGQGRRRNADRPHPEGSAETEHGAGGVLLDPRGQLGDATRHRARGGDRIQDVPRLREVPGRLSPRHVSNDRPAGQPIDRLFALYLLLAGAALVMPQRPSTWPLLSLLHLVALLLAWPPAA